MEKFHEWWSASEREIDLLAWRCSRGPLTDASSLLFTRSVSGFMVRSTYSLSAIGDGRRSFFTSSLLWRKGRRNIVRLRDRVTEQTSALFHRWYGMPTAEHDASGLAFVLPLVNVWRETGLHCSHWHAYSVNRLERWKVYPYSEIMNGTRLPLRRMALSDSTQGNPEGRRKRRGLVGLPKGVDYSQEKHELGSNQTDCVYLQDTHDPRASGEPFSNQRGTSIGSHQRPSKRIVVPSHRGLSLAIPSVEELCALQPSDGGRSP